MFYICIILSSFGTGSNGKDRDGMHAERVDAKPGPGCFEWFGGILHSRGYWEGSLDGHSKAPRVVDCRLHGTPEVSLLFACFLAPPDRHGVGPWSGLDGRAQYICMPGIHYDHGTMRDMGTGEEARRLGQVIILS